VHRSRIRRRQHAIVAAAWLGGCGFNSAGVGSEGTNTDFASDPTTSESTATATTPTTTSQPSDSSASDPTDDPTTGDPTSGDASLPTTDATEASADASDSDSGDVKGWWDIDWAKRRPLTLKLPAPDALDDVPILILLDSRRITYAELQSRGQDLRFIDDDDDTVLRHEIEHWDPNGTSAVWVLVPQFDPSDTIYMYWGNDEAPSGNDPHGVWATGYAGTYHLDDDPSTDAPQIFDSSPSDRHATTQGGMVFDDLVTGFATPALSFDGTDDVAVIGAIDTDEWTELTVSAWVRHTTVGDDRIVSKAFDTGGSDHVFFLGAHEQDVKVRVRTDGADGGTIEVRPADTLPADTWAYVAMVWSAASAQVVVYVDGVEAGGAPLGGDTLADGASDVLIGNAVAGEDRYWDGIIDEVRIEHAARTPEWILVQNASMNDQLVTFEPEEQAP